MPFWTKLNVFTLCITFLHLSFLTSAMPKKLRIGNRLQLNIKNMNNIAPVLVKTEEMHADSFENLMFRRKKNEANELKELFGENGVIYLTEPQDVYVKAINKLVNEIALLKLALRGYDEENKRIATLREGLKRSSRNQFDFNDLVL